MDRRVIPTSLVSEAVEPHSTINLQVELAERSYVVEISENDLCDRLIEIVGKFPKRSHAIVIADDRIHESIAVPAAKSLMTISERVNVVKVPSGEASKSVAELERLWSALYDHHADRSTLIIAIGGGVIGDLAGFAAASYSRGLRLIQVPTTLLAMVDSSVGGKTGINLPSAKNMVGAFWQPSAVVISTKALESLPDREFCSGLAEVVKYGMILDADFFDYIESHSTAILGRHPGILKHLIARSCELKAFVVKHDERETQGLRAILNYGHTYAHAIESATQFGKLLHGEAVSIGMHFAAIAAYGLELIAREIVQRQAMLLQRLGLLLHANGLDHDQLWELMQSDKKVEDGKLGLILPTAIGQVQRVEGVTRDQAFNSELLNEFHFGFDSVGTAEEIS